MKLIPVIRSLKAFIDDVVLHASLRPYATYNELCNRAAEQVQWWEQLVQVTGGSLNPKKGCAIAYTWAPDVNGVLGLQTNPIEHDPVPTSSDNS